MKKQIKNPIRDRINRENERAEQNWGFTGIPRTRWINRPTCKWRGLDSLENFEKNKPKGWTKNSIEYASNKHGYRSVDFVDNDNFTVGSFGCSFTLGSGVPIEHTWPKLFCDLLQEQKSSPVNNYNLGWPGSSADRICRTIFSSMSELKPDLVLVLFPDIYRREMYTEQGYPRRVSVQDKRDVEYYEKYANDYEARNNFLKNFAFIDTFLQLHNIPWLFSLWDKRIQSEMADHKNYAGKFKHFERDLARDMKHPGVRAYYHLASRFFEKYNELYT